MDNKPELTIRGILSTWWPLAMSWFLMALELPALSAIIARLAESQDQSCSVRGDRFPSSADHRSTDHYAPGCLHRFE